MAERGVQIAKKILIKCHEDKTDYRLALLQYRACPVSGTQFSPGQLMMNRNLKTKLPVTQKYLQPKLNINAESEFNKIKSRNTRNYNKNAKCKQSFKIGQNVWFKKEPNVIKWLKGKIVNINNFRSYDILDSAGCTYTRTSFHIRPQ